MILFKVLKREEFEARKQAAEASRLSKRSQQKYEPLSDLCKFHFTFQIIQYYHSCGYLSERNVYLSQKLYIIIYVTDNLLKTHQGSV